MGVGVYMLLHPFIAVNMFVMYHVSTTSHMCSPDTCDIIIMKMSVGPTNTRSDLS